MKFFDVVYTNAKTGRTGKSNASPMTHSEACTFKSKLTAHEDVSYMLVEVEQPLVVNCKNIKVVDLENGVRVKRQLDDKDKVWWGVYVESPVTESGYVLQAEYKTLELAMKDALNW